MTETLNGRLGTALAERVVSLARSHARALSLETYPDVEIQGAGARAAAEQVMRRALLVLSTGDGYALARRLVAGEAGLAAGDLSASLVLQDLAHAGLASWDVGAGTTQPTPLLVELLAILDAAVAEAAGEVEGVR